LRREHRFDASRNDVRPLCTTRPRKGFQKQSRIAKIRVQQNIRFRRSREDAVAVITNDDVRLWWQLFEGFEIGRRRIGSHQHVNRNKKPRIPTDVGRPVLAVSRHSCRLLLCRSPAAWKGGSPAKTGRPTILQKIWSSPTLTSGNTSRRARSRSRP